MFDVDTVFVIATQRNAYPIEDLLRSIEWSCDGSHFTIVVDRSAGLVLPPDLHKNFAVLRIADDDLRVSDDFLRGVGIKWVIDRLARCRQFVGLDDACLLVGKGFDTFLLEKLTRESLGLLGVQDRNNYDSSFDHHRAFFDACDLEHDRFQPDGSTLHGAFLAMSESLAYKLFARGLLVRPDFKEWSLPYGTLMSWAAQMLGYFQVAWGQMDRPMPPLYVNHTERSRHQPPPHILSTTFMLYYSVRHAVGYSEEELREAFKLARGESGTRPTPMQPRVSPRHDGPTVLG